MINKIISVVATSSVMVLLSGMELLAKEQAAAEAAPDISVFWVLPFIGILLCIAIIPLINAHFWERNLWWISLGVFCVPMTVIFTVFMGEKLRELSFEKALDYVSFIILLASLFIISGGILIKGSLSGTPKVNTIFILIGSIIASFIGTTGASMLLVRPLIRANKDRQRKAHVIIFFIFIVSNIGGSLTPLGDPPLFLGYLQGVPFEWTFRLAPQWALACLIVLSIFFILDSFLYRKEPPAPVAGSAIDVERFGIDGKINLFLLAGVVFIVFMQGFLIKKVSWWPRFGPQEGGMALLLILSLVLTPYKSDLRQQNGFTFGPIKEVAYLFAGIFAAMIPALYILEHKGAALGITQPWQFFWSTGILSSFLDNAPTYLTFLSLAKGLNLTRDIILNDGGHVSNTVLTAISCGAVFMGANSYIGNGPNFMVKSIAEEQGIKMPSFFGYMIYSMVILIPTFILITFIFFI
ncbi:MAG TPA: sodium:proton antiporter [Spirochaetota bacterium]|nr:sodium:proton antiporter [Spirochaetota bacterium]